MFQFTLPCRERLWQDRPGSRRFWFQFTLPCRERPDGGTVGGVLRMFQFTLPCRERQEGVDVPAGGGPVSIHAPV